MRIEKFHLKYSRKYKFVLLAARLIPSIALLFISSYSFGSLNLNQVQSGIFIVVSCVALCLFIKEYLNQGRYSSFIINFFEVIVSFMLLAQSVICLDISGYHYMNYITLIIAVSSIIYHTLIRASGDTTSFKFDESEFIVSSTRGKPVFIKYEDVAKISNKNNELLFQLDRGAMFVLKLNRFENSNELIKIIETNHGFKINSSGISIENQ